MFPGAFAVVRPSVRPRVSPDLPGLPTRRRIAASTAGADPASGASGVARLPAPAVLASFLGLLLLLVPAPVLAQANEGRIVGRVTSASTGEPVNGATVQVEGTDLGALTDPDGRYSIDVPAGSYTVRVRTIGFAPGTRQVTVPAGETVTADFALATSAVELERLVVTLAADRDVRARELGTDIETIDAEEALQDATVGNFSDLLNSRSAGVTIAQTSGDAGSASKIRIRGATSLTQDNNPLVYVDGVRASNNTAAGPRAIDQGDGQTVSRLDDIAPEDIESIQILKGPTAAAQYGSEAASGVVLITTQHGEEGVAPRFTATTEAGWATNVSDFNDQFFNLTQFGGFTDPEEPSIQQFDPVQNPVTGDVFARHNPIKRNNFFRKGINFDERASVRGGTEGVTYFGSAKFQEDNGPVPNNFSERFSVRGNFTAEPSDRVDISFSSAFMKPKQTVTGSGRSATNPIANAVLGLPTTGFGRNPDGSLGECLGTFVFGDPVEQCERNRGFILARPDKILAVTNATERRRFLGGSTVNFRPIEGWSNRFTAGIDVIEGRDKNIVPLDPDRPFGNRSRGEIDDFRISERGYTLDYAGTYSTRAGDLLSSSTTLGAQFFGRTRQTLSCQGRGGFPGPNATSCGSSITFSTAETVAETNEVGAYVMQQFGFRNYFFTQAAVRVDDNSGFGANEDVIYSPSVNASFVLSDTPFFNVGFIDNLRLRFAWGEAAQAPGPFAADRTFRQVRVEQGGSQVAGLEPLDPGNPDLTAEENEEVEFGLEGSAFNGRMTFKASYFDQEVTNAILNRRVSPGTGFSGPQFINVASVANDGFEGLVSGRVLDRDDLSWDLNVKFQTEEPIVTDMGAIAPIRGDFQLSGMIHEGFAPGSHFGPIAVDAERDANHQVIPESVVLLPGNLDFEGIPNPRFIDNPQPTHQITLSQNIRVFERLSLSTVFDHRGGHSRMSETLASANCFIIDFASGEMCAMRETLPAELQYIMETDIVDAPQLFVSDARFTKFREATLRWQVPTGFLESLGALRGIEAMTLSIGGRNLKTWSDFIGVDPEADLSGGEDAFGNTGTYGTIAPARTFFGSLSVVF